MQNLLEIQRTLSLGYIINWDQVFGELANVHVSTTKYCFLLRCSIATRVNAIGVKYLRDAMSDHWTGPEYNFDRQAWCNDTLTKLEYYESEYRKLKAETTSILELAMWKIKLDDSRDLDRAMGGGSKQ
jgi:hypothetical protein